MALVLALLLSLVASALAAQTPPRRWTLTPELKIGGDATTGPEYEFTTIRSLTMGPGGAVYVRQGNDQEIRVFDALGRYTRTIGRKGAGPGEFSGLANLGFVGDTLYATDVSLRRVTLFTTSGTLIATIPVEPATPVPGQNRTFAVATPAVLLNDGSALGMASIAPEAAAAPILHLTRSARVLDTVALMSTRNIVLPLRSGDIVVTSIQPFSDAPLAVLAGGEGRAYVVHRDAAGSAAGREFHVWAIGATGDTLWKRSYPYRPVSLPPRVVDSAVTATAARLAPRFTADQVRAALFAPAFEPPITASFVAADGALWLRREDRQPQIEWTVIAPNGDLAAIVTVPRNVRLHAASGEIVWGAELDDVDVPLVVRFRLRK